MIRIGIVGTNWITDRLLDAAREIQGYELSAVYSRTEEKAASFAEKHGIPHTFTDLEAMAASGNVDAVYIASPNAYHAEQAEVCMRHGLHVLCEKPIASNSAEVRRMQETAKQHGVVLMEAMKSTFLPNFAQISLHLPKLGKIRRYVANYGQYSSRYDAYRAGTVLNAFDPALSNGALMDLGIYAIYPAIYWFGKPASVRATGIMLESGADGEGSLLLSYEDMEAVIMYSKISDSSLPSEIQGEDGTLIIDHINEPGRIRLKLRGGTEEDISVPQSVNTMCYEWQAFLDLISRGERESDVNTFERSLAVMEVMDEARRQIGLVYPADVREQQGKWQ